MQTVTYRHFPNRRRLAGAAVGGFSLIEVLIALIVLSTGMLGIAALFLDSLRNSGSAIYRTRAVIYAEDMADRIRVNPQGAASYVTGKTDTGTDHGCADEGSGAGLSEAVACTSQQLAEYDVFAWKQTIGNARIGLPAGEAAIAQDTSTTPTTYTITVDWTEQEQDYSYVLSFQR